VICANETKDPKDVILSVMPVRLGPKDLSYLGDVPSRGRGKRSTLRPVAIPPRDDIAMLSMQLPRELTRTGPPSNEHAKQNRGKMPRMAGVTPTLPESTGGGVC
jgi:hypothetical protein